MPRAAFAILLAAALAPFCSARPSRAEDRVRVAISNFSASYISLHIAQKRGFFPRQPSVHRGYEPLHQFALISV